MSDNQSVCQHISSSCDLSIHSPPICPAFSLSGYLSMSDHLYAILTSLSDHLSTSDSPSTISTSLSACLSPSDHLTKPWTHPSAQLLSPTTQHSHDSSQSLADMNGEQSHKAQKSHRAFTNYDLLLDVSSIYASVSRCVAPHPNQGRMLTLHVECVI